MDNALDLHLCLASILDLGRIHSEDNRGFWRIVERDPVQVLFGAHWLNQIDFQSSWPSAFSIPSPFVQIAWEIFDFMTSMGLDANYSDIDADFVYSKLCVSHHLIQLLAKHLDTRLFHAC